MGAMVLLRDPTLSTSLTAVSRLSTTTPTTMMASSLRSTTRALLPTPSLSPWSRRLLLLLPLWPTPLSLPPPWPMLWLLLSLAKEQSQHFIQKLFILFINLDILTEKKSY